MLSVNEIVLMDCYNRNTILWAIKELRTYSEVMFLIYVYQKAVYVNFIERVIFLNFLSNKIL